MLVILSPAKTQNFSPAPFPFKSSPLFPDPISLLIKTLKAFSPQELTSLLQISPKLAQLNFERYVQFDPLHYDSPNSKACIFAYQGDVYQGLKAETLQAKELEFANQHLLILSGLYGALRPLDAMQPYRLEMAAKLATPQAKNLYLFWQETLTNYVNARLKTEKILLNLASNEYSRVLDPTKLQGTIIQVTFKDWHKNQFKIIGLFAKKARGMMARFIIENQITDPTKLRNFAKAGYQFQAELSSDLHYIFQRQ